MVDDDELLRRHIDKLQAELAACQAMRGKPVAPWPEPKLDQTWHGHAAVLRRISSTGTVNTMFRGSVTQCLKWYHHNVRRRNGRVWIEDVSEPAVLGLRHHKKDLCRASAA